MNSKEQKRLLVLNQINQGKMNGEQASEMLRLSLGHGRLMLAEFPDAEGSERSQVRTPVTETVATGIYPRASLSGVVLLHCAGWPPAILEYDVRYNPFLIGVHHFRFNHFQLRSVQHGCRLSER